MALTTAEAITAGLRNGANAGDTAVAYDERLRETARLFLIQLAQRVHAQSPAWWRHADGQVTVLANTSKIGLPADFGTTGTDFAVWLTDGSKQQLTWADPVEFEQFRQSDLLSRADPTHYTLKQVSTGIGGGAPMIDVWPTPSRDILLGLKNYMRQVPALVDAPLAPGVAVGVGGALSGTYLYVVTYTHLISGVEWETEGGFVSAAVSPATQKVVVTVPVSPVRTVTDRLIYRTTLTGLPPYLLLDSMNDNQTTSYLDNIPDGSLGVANPPTPANSVSGLELLPSAFHESVFVGGLMQMLQAQLKQVPFSGVFSQDWDRDVRRMWADQKNDRHVARLMPAYGAHLTGPRRFRQLT